MTSIGDTLRRERLRRNLDIVSIAAELKISTRFLEAIEAGDFGKLPGGIFTRSFIRQYATFLGLDGNELLAEMKRAAEPDPPVEKPLAKSKPDLPAMQVRSGESWGSVGRPGTGLPPPVKAGALLVVLMLACSALYWWWEKPRHTASAVEIPSPRVMPQAPPAPPPSPPPFTAEPAASQPETPPPSAGQPVATPPVSAAATSTSPSNPNAAIRVAVTAGEPVWIRAEVNGKVQYAGILQANETRNFDADSEVKLRFGNAGGVTVTWNGKPVGPIGPKGQVRNVQFTSGGFQIVSPPISFDPLDRL
jgi:cytoskeletal protein RodZ